MDVEQAVAPDLLGHARYRVDQHLHALERVELAEKGEAVAPAAGRDRARRGDRAALEPVLDHHQLFRRQAPFGEAREQEVRRAHEGVDLGEERLHEGLAPEHVAGADFRHADPAIAGRGPGAERVGARLDHLAVMGADRQVFVQREHDRHVAERPAHGANRLQAEAHHMVEVDHVGAELGEEPLEMRHEAAHVLRGEVEPVEIVRPVERLVGPAPERHERRRLVRHHRRRHAGQIVRRPSGLCPESLEKVVRGDLRAADREGGMGVADDERLHVRTSLLRRAMSAASTARVIRARGEASSGWASSSIQNATERAHHVPALAARRRAARSR